MAKPRIGRMVAEAIAKKEIKLHSNIKINPVPIRQVHTQVTTKAVKVAKPSTAYSGLEAFNIGKATKEALSKSTAYAVPLASRTEGGKPTKKPLKRLPDLSFTRAEMLRIQKTSEHYGQNVYSIDYIQKMLRGSADQREWAENIVTRYKQMASGTYGEVKQTQWMNNYIDAMTKAGNVSADTISKFKEWAKTHHSKKDWDNLPDVEQIAYPVKERGTEPSNRNWEQDLIDAMNGIKASRTKKAKHKKMATHRRRLAKRKKANKTIKR